MEGPQKHRASGTASLRPHLLLDGEFWASVGAMPRPDVASGKSLLLWQLQFIHLSRKSQDSLGPPVVPGAIQISEKGGMPVGVEGAS